MFDNKLGRGNKRAIFLVDGIYSELDATSTELLEVKDDLEGSDTIEKRCRFTECSLTNEEESVLRGYYLYYFS